MHNNNNNKNQQANYNNIIYFQAKIYTHTRIGFVEFEFLFSSLVFEILLSSLF